MLCLLTTKKFLISSQVSNFDGVVLEIYNRSKTLIFTRGFELQPCLIYNVFTLLNRLRGFGIPKLATLPQE